MDAAQHAEEQPRAGRGARGWTILRVRGVPVVIEPSWFVIAALVVWAFYRVFLVGLGGRGELFVLLSAVAAAALFFASLLAHELGHAFTSLDRQIPVRRISLFLMGGVTESVREPARARDELVIVGIGPLISLVLAASFALLHAAVQPLQPFAEIFGRLGWVNLLLAVFNLVPGYPLDGGRLLRAAIWGVTGDPHRSTRAAARVGQAFALLLIAFGVWRALRSGGAFTGVWEILVGAFLLRGAAQAHTQSKIRARLAGLTAGAVMGTLPPVLDPNLPLHEAIVELEHRPSLVWPVGRPLRGVVALVDVDGVPRREWARTRLLDVVHPPAPSVIEADQPMDAVLAKLFDAPHQQLIVTDAGTPVGLVTPSLVQQQIGAPS